MTTPTRSCGEGDDIAREDLTRHQARHLLRHEASLAELYGRRFERAVGLGDLDAAGRWNREYRLSAFRCRTLGTLARTCVAPACPPRTPRIRTSTV